MGHIAKVDSTRNFPKGAWKARYRDGEGRFHSKTFARKLDAERYLAQVTVDLANQDYIDPRSGKQPFSVVAEQWWATKPARKERVREQYRALLDNHVLPHFGHLPVVSITPTLIRSWAANLGIKPDNAYRNVLKPILEMAVEMNLIRKNPAQGVSLPKWLPPAPTANGPHPRTGDPVFLTAEEVDTLAKAVAAMHEPYGTLIYFAAYTGLRAGEIGALRVKHLDLLRRRVIVAESVSSVKGKGLTYGTTKNGKTRVVNLPSFLVDALAVWLSVHPARDREQPHLPLSPDELVFRSPRGAPLRHTGFYERYFKPAVYQSLPPHLHRLRFHDLRHTCASLLINPPISANALTVAEHLGHSDPSITLRVYSHLFKGWEVQLTSGLNSVYMKAHQRNLPPLQPVDTEYGRSIRRLMSADESY
jgi:integrase